MPEETHNIQPSSFLSMSSESKTDMKHLFLIINIASDLFAVPLIVVREIIQPTKIRKIPHTPNYVLGIIDFRGNGIYCIDLKKRLALSQSKSERSVLFIFDTSIGPIAATIDKVVTVSRLETRMMETRFSPTSSCPTDYIGGIAKFKNQLIVNLNIEKVLAISELKKSMNDNYATIAEDRQKTKISLGRSLPTRNLRLLSIESIEENYIIFQLADRLFATKLLDVKEFNQIPSIKKIPTDLKCCMGIANMRGQIIEIFHLAGLLSLETEAPLFGTLLFYEFDCGTIAALVDTIISVDLIHPDSIDRKSISSFCIGQEFHLGMINIDKRPIKVIDLKKILSQVINRNNALFRPTTNA